MLSEFELHNGNLLVKQTGATIPLNADFFRDFARVASFTFEVSAISAVRAARGSITMQHAPRIRIGFTPIVPQVWYAIWPVCHLAGIEIVRNPEHADLLFYFEDKTHTEKLPASGHDVVINGRCLDIRKSRVAAVFEEVFGYSLSVDPMTHQGIALMKSEGNGVHDGQIIPCPYVVPRANHVYQRLIDNTADGRTYIDIRTPVVGNALPIAYLKHRTSSTRFSNDNAKVELTSPDSQFSLAEQEKILQFANAIGLEFGGLDVLRDRKDGRIYIVDVNKTDMGPPTALPRTEKLVAMQKLADAFLDYVNLRLRRPEAA